MTKNNKLKNFKISLKAFRISLGWDADKDWKMLGVIFFLLFLVTLGFNIYFFIHFRSGAEGLVTHTSEIEIINREKVTKLIESFNARALEFQKIKQETVTD